MLGDFEKPCTFKCLPLRCMISHYNDVCVYAVIAPHDDRSAASNVAQVVQYT